MRLWPLATVLIACAAAAGCRPTRAMVANSELERENRELEDQLYQLKWELDASRQENESLRQKAGPVSVAGPVLGPMLPSISPPKPDLSDEVRAPAVEAPPVAAPSGSTPSGSSPDPGDAPRFRAPDSPPPPAGPFPAQPSPRQGTNRAVGLADSRQVARLTLDAQATGACDMDGQPGVDGIAAVIEPRDAEDRLTLVPAEVSVVLLDPALSGEAARVARWDFPADRIAAACQLAAPGQGIHLEMGWPGVPPARGRMHLFVRYTTADGRKLQADRQIDLEPVRPR